MVTDDQMPQVIDYSNDHCYVIIPKTDSKFF